MVGLALPVVASTMEELTAWARLVVLSGALLGRTPVLPEARCMCMRPRPCYQRLGACACAHRPYVPLGRRP